MFTLVNSVMLGGMLALLIPIAIHLFNPGKGQIVWVGHIELLLSRQKSSLQEIHIRQWLLLLLRVLLVAVATLLLVEPQWLTDDQQPPLIIVSDDYLAQASPIERQQLAQIAGQRAQAQSQPATPAPQASQQLWAKLAYFDYIQPSQQPFVVYSSATVGDYIGLHKPSINRPIQWQTPSGSDSALATAADTTRQAVAVKVRIDGGQTQPLLQQQLLQQQLLQQQLLQQHLTLALGVIKKYQLANIEVGYGTEQAAEQVTPEQAAATWLFWLAASPVSPALLDQVAQGATLLTLSAAAFSKEAFSAAAFSGAAQELSETASLQRQAYGQGWLYQVTGDWQTWLQQVDFPAQLQQLMAVNLDFDQQFSPATTTAAQLQPVTADHWGAAGDGRQAKGQSLQTLLWLLLALLWLMERLVAVFLRPSGPPQSGPAL